MEGKQDKQTVTTDGNIISNLIDGVKVRKANTIIDSRGTLCEILTESWNFHEAPIIHVYQITVRPNTAKGWVIHYEQADRLFISQGSARIVLYDDRPESSTRGIINEIYASNENRNLILIPSYVWHTVQNIGNTDMLFINMPTKAYNYENPDKYRLPLNTDKIPYQFDSSVGGW